MTTIKDVIFNDLTTNAKLADHSRQQHQNTADVFSNLSGKRVYFCQRCLNHDILAPRKNHKCECIHAQCNCAKCILVERRRVLNTQLHELEENEQQQQQQRCNNQPNNQPKDVQQLSEKYFQNVFVFEKSESAQLEMPSADKQQQPDIGESAWKNSALYKTLSERLRPQPPFPDSSPNHDRNLETLQALLLQNGLYNYNEHILPNLANFQPQFTPVNKKASVDSTESGFGADVDRETPFGDLSFPKESRENSLTSVDSFSDELQSFRSRISTINSIKSSTTTNSSSSTTSPVGFATDCNVMGIDGDGMGPSAANSFQSMSPAFSYNPTTTRMKGDYDVNALERVPNCQKCGQHGHKSRLKGHKRYCPFKNCNCAKCQVITERQKLMADQIKIRRRQCKDTLMRLKRDKMSELQHHALAENQNIASRLQFPAEQLVARNCPTISASYFNALNMLCKQFTSTPMMSSPQRTAATLPLALANVAAITPISTVSGGVIKCTNTAQTDFRSDSIEEKANKTAVFYSSPEVIETHKLAVPPSNHLLSNFLLPAQQAKFFHNFAKSAQHGLTNEQTSGVSQDSNVTISATSPRQFNDDNATAADCVAANLSVWDKPRAEAFLRFLQQRQQLNFYNAIATNYPQKADQGLMMKRQQMECDEPQLLLNQQQESEQRSEEIIEINNNSDHRNVAEKAQPGSLLQLLSLNHDEDQRHNEPPEEIEKQTSMSDKPSQITTTHEAVSIEASTKNDSSNGLTKNQSLDELVMMQSKIVFPPSHKLIKIESDTEERSSPITVDVLI